MAISEQEITLVRAVQNKDQKSFEELYRKYYRKIYAIAFATTKNASDAEDILQITFSKVWQSISSLKDPATFNTWIQKIAINESNNLLNKRKPSVSIDEEEYESPVTELESDLMLPEVYAEREDLSARLRQIIYELSDVQRQTVMLFYFDNLTISEISQIMDCTESTVKSRLYLARKAIRTEIEEQERKTGTKFFGIIGIPVLPFAKIFIGQVEQSLISESSATVIFKKIKSTVLSAASTAASKASETAKAAGATAAKKGISSTAKAIIGVISGSVVIGGIAGTLIGVSISGKSDSDVTATTAAVAETTVEDTTDSQATEPSTAPEYLDAYNAYKSVLENDETSVRNFTWQLVEGNESRPVVFCDIFGDETPEMIYSYVYQMSSFSTNQGYTKLNIYTYEGGNAKCIFTSNNNFWDQNDAGAGVSTFLFQVEDEKTLYAFHKGADQHSTKKYYQFKEINGSLEAEEYKDATFNLAENISNILMMSEGMPESQGIDTTVHKNKAMTYDEAIAFLNGIMGDNITVTESVSYEVKRKVYEAYSNVIKESRENDNPNSKPESYFVYDVDKDDIPELFIVIGTGLQQRYEMYTFKNSDDKATHVKEFAGADSGPSVGENGNLYITGGRSDAYFRFCVVLNNYEYSSEPCNPAEDIGDQLLECTDISNLTKLQNEVLY